MTFAELYRATIAHVGPGVGVSVDVTAWRHTTNGGDTPELSWSIFVTGPDRDSTTYDGPTPEIALGRLVHDDHDWLPPGDVDAVGEVSL